MSQLDKLPRVSKKVVESISALAGKESNEGALHTFLQAVVPHISFYLSTEKVDAKTAAGLVQCFQTGLSDSKSGVRKAYLFALETAIGKPSLNKIGDITKLVEIVVKIVERVQNAGVALLDPKKETPAIVEGYLGVRWIQEVLIWERESGNKPQGKSCQIFCARLLNHNVHSGAPDKTKFLTGLLGPPPKSFLLNEKLYSKLASSPDEQMPFVRTIFALIRDDGWYESSLAANALPLLASALVFVLVQSSQLVRRAALKCLDDLVSSGSNCVVRVVGLLRTGLASILHEHAKETAAKREILAWNDPQPRSSRDFGHRVYTALQTGFPVGENNSSSERSDQVRALEGALLDVAVIACHPIICATMGDDVWVRLCFRVGTGPHIVDTYGAKWIESRVSADNADLSHGGLSDSIPIDFRNATLAAITLFTEVATQTVLPTVIPWCLGALQNAEVNSSTHTDVAVWATPEGTLHFDPTVKKVTGKVDDRPKTAEEKWERELRKELDAKRGAKATTAGKGSKGGEKLTKAEMELKIAQTEKEAQIRKRVQALRSGVINSLDVLDAILNGIRRSVGDESRESFGLWIGKVIDVVLHGLIARELFIYRNGQKGEVGAVLAGKKGLQTFVNLAEAAGEKIEDLVEPPVLSAAILRAGGVLEGSDGLDEKYCKQPVSSECEFQYRSRKLVADS